MRSKGDEISNAAVLLPSTYSNYRYSVKYDPYQDIRGNILRKNSPFNTLYYLHSTYVYYVETNTKGCESLSWTQDLLSGNVVCAECHLMRGTKMSICNGQGFDYQLTHWRAQGVNNCRGTWQKISNDMNINCSLLGMASFIFL